MSANLVAAEGPCFLIVDQSGDVSSGRELGLYDRDSRFLSAHTLRINDAEPLLLSARAASARRTVHFLCNPELPGVPRGALVVRRIHEVAAGLHSDLDVTCHAPEAALLELELAWDADFAELGEIKRQIEARAPAVVAEPSVVTPTGRTALVLARIGAHPWPRTEIRFSRRPIIDGRSARFEVRLEPGASFRLCIDVFTITRPDFEAPAHGCARSRPSEARAAAVATREVAPAVESDDAVLVQGYRRAIADLEALRLPPDAEHPEEIALAAGAPWSMTLVGRDALVAAHQALPWLPELAPGVLRAWARHQGTGEDQDSVDATALYLVVAAACHRRGGDDALARSLLPSVRAALGRLLGRLDGDPGGFLSDAPRAARGPVPPIARVEAQGYAVEALRQTAALLGALGERGDEGAALGARADALAAALDRTFWMEQRSSYALALDGAGRVVDALASAAGHLLWSGAVPEPRAQALTRVLGGPELFTGFGLRTRGANEPLYNPISYRNGSVWPADTSLAAAGLARYGARHQAARLCGALLDAAEHFPERRLPELFGGFAREDIPFPVEHPTANAPHAVAAGALLLALTTMLGLDVDASARVLRLRPSLPQRVGHIAVRGLRLGDGTADLSVRREGDRLRAEAAGLPEGWTLDAPR
jgi:glycogen debranching enzyme